MFGRTLLWVVLTFALVAVSVALLIGPNYVRDDLVEAARQGDTQRINLLLALGANPSRVGFEEHVTPLGAAAQSGRSDVVRLLLRKSANVNEKDDHQETALGIARRHGKTEIVRLLEAAGGHP